MRYAIIADIHANLPALRTVLRDIDEQRCDQIACLGDTVGYNENPKECLDLIRSLAIPCVKGNHDEYCSADTELEGFNPQAAEFVRWTREQLTDDDRRWLRDLPYVQVLAGFTLVHATLDEPRRWGYVFDKIAAAAHFEHQTTPVCFNGHTHVPVTFMAGPVMRGGSYSKFVIEPGQKYLVNAGSVGQPRDGSTKASYVIYDLDKGSIELRQLAYPQSDSGGGSGRNRGPVPVIKPSGGGRPSISGTNPI